MPPDRSTPRPLTLPIQLPALGARPSSFFLRCRRTHRISGAMPALRQREPDGERERIRDAEETTTCAGDDQCPVVPTLPSFVSAVIDSPSTRAAASTSEPSASNLSAPASNPLTTAPGPYPSLLPAASAVDHPTSGLRPADGPSMRACKTCAKPTERLTLGPGLLAHH